MIRLFLALALLALAAPRAQAHAFLDHASPSVGSTVHGSPPAVQLFYTQNLEPAFSTVQVVDANGKQVDKGNKTVDPKNPAELEISLNTLPPGDYKVIWRVLSVDTHTTEGKFTFTVAP
ncbi:MAG TPA: copper resistance protein CopC [Stellaceae bacterium]|nr:copper resistance protein CopC [Stellaceae bacterium]